MKIGYLVSGKLGFLILERFYNSFNTVFIATDSKSDLIIKFANEKNISLYIGNPRKGKLREFIKNLKIDVLFSINYLFLIEKDIIELSKYPINLHGSLLPKYRGRTPHVWAIINNEDHTGITAHIIDEGCDTGGVVLQKAVEISSTDTGADILRKFEIIYPEMILEIVNLIEIDKIVVCPQDNTKATYFCKRTKEDGAINWDWQKERIRNWVRAQAFPYPGAFSVLEGKKIIIDKIAFSNIGFCQNDPNGLVLSTRPDVVIKTSNGAVLLEIVRSNKNIIKKGKILGK